MATIQPLNQSNRLVDRDGFFTVEFKRHMDLLLQRTGGMLGGSYLPLTDGASIDWDLEQRPVAFVVLSGNRSVASPTNITPGLTYKLTVIQDAVGNRTLTWGSAYKFPSGAAPTLSTAGNAVDEFVFNSDSSNMKCVIFAKDLR